MRRSYRTVNFLWRKCWIQRRLFSLPSAIFINCTLRADTDTIIFEDLGTINDHGEHSYGVRWFRMYFEEEIRSVEHGICPIAELRSPWLNCVHSNRIPYPLFCWCRDIHVLLKNTMWILKGKVTMANFRFFKMAAAAMMDFWNYKVLTVRRIISAELRPLAKFRGDWSNCCHDISNLDIWRWWQPQSWIFKILFLTHQLKSVAVLLQRSRRTNCVTVPNFVEIAQTTEEISQFSIFQDGRRRLGFLKFQIFNGRDGKAVQNASSCQISSKSFKQWLRYGYFSIFRMAAAAVLDL